MTEWMSNITQYGYLSLTIASFFHGAGWPVPAEVLLLAMALLLKQQRIALFPALLLFAAANALGALIPYYVGKAAGVAVAPRAGLNSERRDRVVRGLQKYGALMVAATRIIGFMRYICLLLAGTCGIPYYKVAAATFAGTIIYTIGGLLLLRLGWAAISNFGFLLILPAVLAIIIFVWRRGNH